MADPRVVILGPCVLHFVGAYHTDTRHGPRRLSPLGNSLRAFKDGGDRYAGRCLADLFARACAPIARDLDVIVPIPADVARLRVRGFNPAAWLARALSRASGSPMRLGTLARLPGHPPQRSLGGKARRANASGAFQLGAADLRGYSIALVDDVVTTGATMLDAVRCLNETGAGRIACVALACADADLIP